MLAKLELAAASLLLPCNRHQGHTHAADPSWPLGAQQIAAY
jgi:hypothetical protein